jgi:hypothetical protein
MTPDHLESVEQRLRHAITEALGGEVAYPTQFDIRVAGSVGYPDGADARSLLDEALSALNDPDPGTRPE